MVVKYISFFYKFILVMFMKVVIFVGGFGICFRLIFLMRLKLMVLVFGKLNF